MNTTVATHPKTHLCLVSNQPIPSLTPLIDKELGTDEVLLIAAPDRCEHATWLYHALGYYGIRAEIIMLRDGYSLPLLREDFALLREQLPPPVAINLTGGTKLMTLAAWETFNSRGDVHYYVNINTDAIDWLRPDGRAPHLIADRLLIEPYLIAWGAFLDPKVPPQRDAVPESRRELAYKLLASKQLRDASSQLRDLLQGSSKDDTFQTTNVGTQLRLLLRPLEQGGVIHRHERGYRFSYTHGRRFVDGCWLEEAVFEILRELARKDRLIHDVVLNLKFHRAGSLQDSLVNEIDVACLRNNTLYLIECKTGQMVSSGAGMSVAEQAIHKLDASKNAIGGLRSRALLVSQRGVSPTVRKRAAEKDIAIIDGDAITALAEHLREWMYGSVL